MAMLFFELAIIISFQSLQKVKVIIILAMFCFLSGPEKVLRNYYSENPSSVWFLLYRMK